MRFILIILLLSSTFAYSQKVQVRSRFLADTLKIGEKVPFAVTARYPSNTNILFPDTAFSFAPYELDSKEFFQTKTTDSISYDSVVYHLLSYEIDSVQTFRMPVYVLQGSDCTAVYGALDSIRLKEYVADVPDSVSVEQLPLKTNTSYLNVSWLFNYPIAFYITGALILVVLIVWIFFGKRIRKYYRLKRMAAAHADFRQRFENAIQQIQSDFSAKRAEAALILWKRYMEGLEQQPYTKYSSKEILFFLNDQQLHSALRTIDRMVYGGISSDTAAFQELQQVSSNHYNEKLRKVTNE